MDKVLELLMDRQDKYVSGEEMSSYIGISRTAVWKHIKTLRETGFDIKAETKKGYKLIDIPDLLLPNLIEYYLPAGSMVKNIIRYETIGSTNEAAKGLAANGSEEGTLLVSEEQLSGKGRITKGWYSPKSEGIYCSIILRPNVPIAELSKLTQLVGLGIARAMRNEGLNALIKWPNDIVIGGKKVCGILTEMAAEMDRVHYVVAGFGINVNNYDFPEELKDIATSLYLESGKRFDRNKLLASVLREINLEYNRYINGEYNGFIKELKDISVTLGKRVRILRNNMVCTGMALDILPSGALLVETDKGNITEVQAGEVSVRGVMGYV